MTAPWPMGRIDQIVANIKPFLPNQTEYREQLQKWRSEGRKTACLILPNVSEVEVCGYRINMWDDQKKCVWNYEVELKEGETLEEVIAREVPQTTEDGVTLKSFSEVLTEKLPCPHCGVEMEQSRWFSNNE